VLPKGGRRKEPSWKKGRESLHLQKKKEEADIPGREKARLPGQGTQKGEILLLGEENRTSASIPTELWGKHVGPRKKTKRGRGLFLEKKERHGSFWPGTSGEEVNGVQGEKGCPFRLQEKEPTINRNKSPRIRGKKKRSLLRRGNTKGERGGFVPKGGKEAWYLPYCI